MKSLLTLVLITTSVLLPSLSSASQSAADAAIPDNHGGERPADLASDDTLLAQTPEIFKVVVSVEDIVQDAPAPPPPAALGKRHLDEKARLLKRLSKKHGRYNQHHPRHRLLDALHSFTRYAELHEADLDRWRDRYRSVSKKQHLILETTISYSQKFTRIQSLIAHNAALAAAIAAHAQRFYDIPDAELAAHIAANEAKGFRGDRVSVAQALKHYVRDWSAAGAAEREPTYPCVLGALERLFPDRGGNGGRPRVLLPGAGLGRLGHEVAGLGGFEVTINEWSTYMLLPYRYLSSLPPSTTNTHALHPFIDTWSHQLTTAHHLRPIAFPDVPFHDPNPNASDVLLIEGDFTTAFTSPQSKEAYSAVLTFFFIDTARNLLSYLETIHAVLRPGGVWINFGPLLYGTGPFVQLSLEEVVLVAEAMGFEILEQDFGNDISSSDDSGGGGGGGGGGSSKEEQGEESVCGSPTFPGSRKVWGKDAIYGFDERAMTRNAYRAQFWVARKKAEGSCQQKPKKKKGLF